jgi:EmrB/QacA subfamily drug resistance transporter
VNGPSAVDARRMSPLVPTELPGAEDTRSVSGPPSSSTVANPWIVLVSTGFAMFAVFLDTTILFIAFAAIGADFPRSGTSALSWILNAYTIVFAAMLIPAGRLADRIGRRRTFLGAVVLFTIASMLCGVAPSVGFLVAARMLQAVGAAALVPSSLALILQTFPRSKVPLAVSIWSAVGAVAGTVGPTLGAVVIQHLGWRWAFYINLPVGVFSLLLGMRVLPEGRERNPGRFPDPASIALLMGSLALMAYALVQTSEWGWISASFASIFAASLVLLAVFIARSRRIDNPLFDLTLFNSTSFRLANLGMLIYSTGFSAMFLGNVLFLTRVWGYTILRAGLVISAGPLVVAMLAPLFGRLAGRVGQRTLLIPGGLVWSSAPLLLLLTATAAPHDFAQYLPAVLLMGLGVSICLPQLSSVSVQGLPPDSYGAGSAVNQALRNLGATLGVALVLAFNSNPVAAAAMNGFHRTWWLLIVSGAAVSLVSFFLPRRPHAVPPTAANGAQRAIDLQPPAVAID